MIKPVEDMFARAAVAREESDTAYFYDLLMLGELLLKVQTLAVLALLDEDPERHRIRQVHRLVRANSPGEWASVLEACLAGVASQALAEAAYPLQAALTSRVSPATWQYDAVAAMNRVLGEIDPSQEQLGGKCALREWFPLFAELRNKTRGHGAQPPHVCARLCSPLYDSVQVLAQESPLLKLEWAYLHRNLSGKYRVTALTATSQSFDYLRSAKDRTLEDGTYINLDAPRRVELMFSDADGSDFQFPNGGFTHKRFEVLSYRTGVVSYRESEPYLLEPTALPGSATAGLGALEPLGHTMSNMPASRGGYVTRPELETELERVLTDERNPVVTLGGGGGVGKTSLALTVLHRLSKADAYYGIIWLSARDIDLLPQGPKLVKPDVLSLKDIASEVARLLGPDEGKQKGFDPRNYLARILHQSPLGVDAPLLFVFDNFETVHQPVELFTWLNNAIRLPNRILITTRFHEFKGDYDLHVGGMTEAEADELMHLTGAQLGLGTLLTEQVKREVYVESAGHPYVMKIMLGEFARSEGKGRIRRIVAAQDDILQALFERTWAGLTPAARRVFLLLCSWRSAVPVIAVEATILRPANERLDVHGALSELEKYSLVQLERSEVDDGVFVSMPLAASLFGQRKLAASPYKAAVEADSEILQLFGASQRTDIRHGLRPRFERLFRHVAERLSMGRAEWAEMQSLLESVARKYPAGWMLLAQMHLERGDVEGRASAKEAVMRFIESGPELYLLESAWENLSQMNHADGDASGELHALTAIALLPSTPFSRVSSIVNRVNDLLYAHRSVVDTDEKRVMCQKLAHVMSERMAEGDATDFSRLGWLNMHLKDFGEALRVAEEGLKLDPASEYCLNLQRKAQSEVSRVPRK